MKTLVIQLDRTEDAGSIRDKVTWGKASRVLLVWPVNTVMFERKIDLVAIRRICASQGSRLGIVCDIPEVMAEAEELQLPVFESVNHAMRKSWERRKSRKGKLVNSAHVDERQAIEILRLGKAIHFNPLIFEDRVKIPIFLLAVLSVFILLIFLLPSATIIIYPQSQTTEMTIIFEVRENSASTNSPGVLSASSKTAIISGDITIPTSGSIEIPNGKATGAVTIINLTEGDIVIPERTIIHTNTQPSVRFYLMEEVLLSGKATMQGIKIEAIEEGLSGNIVAETLSRMDGPIGSQVEINNPLPTSGGSVRTYRSVTQIDVDQAIQQLEKRLANQAVVEISHNLSEEEILLPTTIININTIEVSEFPKIGQTSDSVRVSASFEFSGLVIQKDDLESQAEIILSANQPLEGWTGIVKNPAKVSILSQTYNPKDRIANLVVLTSKKFIPPVDIVQLQNLFVGKPLEDAEVLLSETILQEQLPEIRLLPSWSPIMPFLSSRIHIEVR
jgi:hypothetical protein